MVEKLLKMIYNLPYENIHGHDEELIRMTRMKSEYLELLNATMTNEQKELLEAYLDADSKLESMKDLDRFRFAFYFGVQYMTEMIEDEWM